VGTVPIAGQKEEQRGGLRATEVEVFKRGVRQTEPADLMRGAIFRGGNELPCGLGDENDGRTDRDRRELQG